MACPSCGRADVDVMKLANSVDEMIKKIKTPLKVAVMGCEVNGPGEAKDADVGIAAAAAPIIFRKGKKAALWTSLRCSVPCSKRSKRQSARSWREHSSHPLPRYLL